MNKESCQFLEVNICPWIQTSAESKKTKCCKKYKKKGTACKKCPKFSS